MDSLSVLLKQCEDPSVVLHSEYLIGSAHSVMLVSWRPILGSVGS